MGIPLFLVEHLDKFRSEIEYLLMNDFSALNEIERKEKVAEARQKGAWGAALVAPQPIPFADIWLITPVQILMVRAIGNIHGYELSEDTVKELLSVIGGGWLGQQVCLALFKIGMPGAGGLGGAAFVFFWTYAMGKAAEVYFASGMTASKEDLKKARQEGMKEAQNAYKNQENSSTIEI